MTHPRVARGEKKTFQKTGSKRRRARREARSRAKSSGGAPRAPPLSRSLHGVHEILQRLELGGRARLEQVLHAPAELIVAGAHAEVVHARRRQVLRPRVPAETDAGEDATGRRHGSERDRGRRARAAATSRVTKGGRRRLDGGDDRWGSRRRRIDRGSSRRVVVGTRTRWIFHFIPSQLRGKRRGEGKTRREEGRWVGWAEETHGAPALNAPGEAASEASRRLRRSGGRRPSRDLALVLSHPAGLPSRAQLCVPSVDA